VEILEGNNYYHLLDSGFETFVPFCVLQIIFFNTVE
jgi:hypothetical protein